MSVLCANGTHVTLANADACMCGAVAAWDALSDEALFNFEDYCAANNQSYPASGGIFPGYHPNNYAPPRPPTAGAAPPVSIAVFRAAQLAGASHLSADGLRIYTVRYGETLEAEWKEWLRDFGAWSVVKEMPPDAVKM